jgi:CRAL/TRIO domain
MGVVYVINTGWLFWTFWKVISPFVPKRTMEKIQFLRGPDQYIPVLCENLGKENVPKCFGGTKEVDDYDLAMPPLKHNA